MNAVMPKYRLSINKANDAIVSGNKSEGLGVFVLDVCIITRNS